MSDTLQMGAIDTETNIYFSPYEAVKGKKYTCNDCGNRVILRKGSLRKPHFAHYSQTNTCTYYDHPSESQVHKDAKALMKKLISEKKKIQFVWECDFPACHKNLSNCYVFQDNPTIIYKEGDEVILEHRDKDNKWVADVAVVNNGEVRYIIEIKYTHQTDLGRPEPWFEVVASSFIQSINGQIDEAKSNGFFDDWTYFIKCERKNIRRYCYGSFCYRESWVNRIPGYNKELVHNDCLLCGANDYCPVTDGCTDRFQHGELRICYDCLEKDTYEKKIPTKYKPRCNGSCFIQNDHGYEQNRRRYCTEDCKLYPCSKCSNQFPKILLDCYDGRCMGCDMSAYCRIYLNVPFAQKEEAKSLGARWDPGIKKWYINKDSNRKQEVLKKFKQISTGF